jgi:hypothetical protein
MVARAFEPYGSVVLFHWTNAVTTYISKHILLATVPPLLPSTTLLRFPQSSSETGLRRSSRDTQAQDKLGKHPEPPRNKAAGRLHTWDRACDQNIHPNGGMIHTSEGREELNMAVQDLSASNEVMAVLCSRPLPSTGVLLRPRYLANANFIASSPVAASNHFRGKFKPGLVYFDEASHA